MKPSARTLFRVAQVAFAAAALWFAARVLARQWSSVREAARHAHVEWLWIVASCLVVLATYLALIQAWRSVVEGWSARLPFGAAARIWFISSLGRYVPGKVWQLGSMAVMSQRQGASAVAAAGSAVLVTVINTVAGFVVLAATGAHVLDIPPVAALAIAATGIAALLAPRFLPALASAVARRTGRTVKIEPLPSRALVITALISLLAWTMYGVAFHWFSRGVIGVTAGGIATSVAIFTGSYLAGFLTLIAPGGLLVREAVMQVALVRLGVPAGPAILLVVASRLWLTMLEITPALLFLAHGALRPAGTLHRERVPRG
ncbi:MAG TPA: lysylphosphatidylglycerol synthase domain-containing protein [Gemmatimonadaceae bacterium]|nr:lysylphosphatidylglycerol synthase domain-containing protein [Gemmatimonadaceae bacterium]